MRAAGCNPLSPWRCALVWGATGVAIGFAIGAVMLTSAAAGCPL